MAMNYKQWEEILSTVNKEVTLPRKSGEKVWNVFYKKNDASNCSGMQ
ncbi:MULTISPECIES: hypothetical protein [unclassified Wolbachia]|uniref:Uncharacterized protein n=1 Tax=Wolbachia endosymbiont of Sergentomyia squamirostris TaxID=3113640 RepID=A0AAT9GBJ3_9RICK|nr:MULTISPECIES: hypothetical protein [unclassified Wolbachia]UZE38120.1 hypothetical protein ONI09_04265 [Wolbachia endosymbiont of Drosophila pseudotakahashii]